MPWGWVYPPRAKVGGCGQCRVEERGGDESRDEELSCWKVLGGGSREPGEPATSQSGSRAEAPAWGTASCGKGGGNRPSPRGPHKARLWGRLVWEGEFRHLPGTALR